MNQPIDPPLPPGAIENPLSLKELAEVLVRHYKLKEGHYEAMIEFMVGMANVGPSPEKISPSSIVGISRIGLIKVQQPTVNSVDAAAANPTRKRSAK